MEIQEYFEKLESHDWHYEFSDDHNVWKKGHEEHRRLTEVSGQSDIHERMYLAFVNYHSSGEAFGTAKAPKPKLSDFLTPAAH